MIFFLTSWSFVWGGEVAASPGWYNCRSPLPTVALTLVPAPVALFLPGLRSPTLTGSIQGIYPSVLGVPLLSATQMANQVPCKSNTTLSYSLTSCFTRQPFICIYHVIEQNKVCFAKGVVGGGVWDLINLPALPVCCGCLLLVNMQPLICHLNELASY